MIVILKAIPPIISRKLDNKLNNILNFLLDFGIRIIMEEKEWNWLESCVPIMISGSLGLNTKAGVVFYSHIYYNYKNDESIFTFLLNENKEKNEIYLLIREIYDFFNSFKLRIEIEEELCERSREIYLISYYNNLDDCHQCSSFDLFDFFK